MKSYKKQGRPHYDDRVDSLLLATYSNDVLFPVKTTYFLGELQSVI